MQGKSSKCFLLSRSCVWTLAEAIPLSTKEYHAQPRGKKKIHAPEIAQPPSKNYWSVPSVACKTDRKQSWLREDHKWRPQRQRQNAKNESVLGSSFCLSVHLPWKAPHASYPAGHNAFGLLESRDWGEGGEGNCDTPPSFLVLCLLRFTRVAVLWNSTSYAEIFILIPPNSNTFSDWRRTCHVSWVTTTFKNFRLARDQVLHLCCATQYQANNSFAVYFLFLSWEV